MSNRHQRKLKRGHIKSSLQPWQQEHNNDTMFWFLETGERKLNLEWLTLKKTALLLCCHRIMSNRHQRKLKRGHIQGSLQPWQQGHNNKTVGWFLCFLLSFKFIKT